MRKLFIPILLSTVLLFSPALTHAGNHKPKKCKIVAEDGSVSKGKMLDSLKEGEWKTYDAQKRLIEKMTYTHGVENGPCTYYFPEDTSYTTGAYTDGKIDGTWTTFNSKQKAVRTVHWHLNQMEGTYSDYSNGKQTTGQYLLGKKTGWWIESDAINNILDSTFFLEGKKEGRSVHYVNNVLRSVNYWKLNQRNGLAYEFDEDGKISHEAYYNMNSPDSLSRKFEHGNIREEFMYCGGRFCGTSKIWNGQTNALETVTYYDSTGNRISYEGYDEEGNMIRKTWFSGGGQMDSIYIYRNEGSVWYIMKDTGSTVNTKGKVFLQDFRYPSGITQYVGLINNSQRTGMWIYNDSAGHVERKINYDAGTLNGSFTVYYPNGKVRLQTWCYMGHADTMHVFNPAGKEVAPSDPLFNATLTDIKNTQYDIDFRNPNNFPAAPAGRKTTAAFVPGTQPEGYWGTQAPSFPGGSDSLNAFVKRNAIYPAVEKAYGKQDTVYVKFTVELDGSLTGLQIVTPSPVTPGFDKEALRLVRKMPRWMPAKDNEKTVRVIQVIGISFRID